MSQGFAKFAEDTHPKSVRRNLDRRIAAFLDGATASHARALALLAICALVFFLPGFLSTPPVDRDEARFAQATKQMVESGDYIDIRFQNAVRYKKPIGIYWLQAAAVKTAEAVGIPGAKLRVWIYRLPSLAGAAGAVLLTYWAALAFITRRGALLAALVMCASILLGVEARLAKTDAMLLASAIATMGAMARAYLSWRRETPLAGRGWLVPAIFWTALAGAVLIKGPVVLMLVAITTLTLVIFDRSGGWILRLRPFIGLIWLLVLILPWFAAIVMRAGETFFARSLGDDMFAKLVSGQESHGAWPGYYFILFWVTFWPGAALTGMATPAILRAWREPGAMFLLAWLVPNWAVFELVPTKLPHYVLPLYPAVAILTIGALELRRLSPTRWLARGASWWFWIAALICIAAIAGAITLLHRPMFLAWPFAALAIIFGLAAWWLYNENRAETSLVKAIIASAFVSLCVFGTLIPQLTPLFPSAEIGRFVRTRDCAAPLIAAAGYHEPSLVFMVGTGTALTSASGAADFLLAGACHFALVEGAQQWAFARRAEAIGLRYAVRHRFAGYNISQGRKISLTIFEGEDAP